MNGNNFSPEQIVGQKVVHKKFGTGIIKVLKDGRIIVQFDSSNEEKQFVYPSCFDSFLCFADEKMAKTVRQERDSIADAVQHQPKTTKQSCVISMQNASSNVVCRSVDDFCDKYISQLQNEAGYLMKTGGKHEKLFDGKLVEMKNQKFYYTFTSDSELNYPADTVIQLWLTNTPVAGSILSCEGFTVVVVTESSLGDTVSVIEFSATPWKLLYSLIERLDKMRNIEAVSNIAKTLISEGRNNIDLHGALAKGQDTACKMAMTQPITFIWGPPGTGKTETLARIAIEYMNRGNRVLMLSCSNVSVDGAILRVVKRLGKVKPGTVLRYGYPRDEALLNHKYLHSYNYILYRYADLVKEKQDLQQEQKKMSAAEKKTSRYLEIQRRLLDIANLFKHEEKQAVRDAKFVATTVSKAVVDKTLYGNKFDAVIFDEASMAYIPQIVFAANLATRHFICMGDFSQLPPIVQSDSAETLHSDIFQYCGITDAVQYGWGHKWLCMLDMQYRMHPDIAEFAGLTMYHSLLKSAGNMRKDRLPIAVSAPLRGKAVGLVDLSGMMSVCTTTADKSRINPLSALVAVGLAISGAKEHEVSIITPYHAQSRLIHAMIRDIEQQQPKLHTISCATVHQFQGSEQEMIVFDAVDCYRQTHPGVLLTSMRNNSANRLFNVALTRAKGKFIAVANEGFLSAKGLSTELIFRKLLNICKTSGQSVKREQIAAEMPHRIPCYAWLAENQAHEKFFSDVMQAKHEIRIDIPGPMTTDITFANSLKKLLTAAKKRAVKVIVRVAHRSDIPEQLREMSVENRYIANAITTIDRKITWFGEPDSRADFVSEGRALKTTYRPLIRFEGKHTATALYGFLEMNRIIDQSDAKAQDNKINTFAQYVGAFCKCKQCGKPMKLAKSRKNGRFFLSCTGYPKCNGMERITTDLVEDYLYHDQKTGKHCVRCNTSLEAKSGQFGVYVRCCGLQQHTYHLDQI